MTDSSAPGTPGIPAPGGPRKSTRTLTLTSIGDIDRGRVALAFNHALRMATLDVQDRPADKAKRKVQLTVELTPELDKDSGVLDTIGTEFVIKTTVPVRRSASYPMLPTNDGKQIFRPASPFDPRQEAFAFADLPPGMNPATGEVDDDEGEEARI